MENIKEKLKSEIGPAKWEDLKFFAINNTLILLNKDLDVLEVGLHIATDNVSEIQKLLDTNSIIKPEISKFTEMQDNKFECLILDPFVICKLLD